MNGEDGLCLDSLPFRRRHPISLPEQNQTLVFPPLAIEIEAGRCSRTCPIYLDDWLVSTLLTRFVRQRHNVISCVSELEKDDPKILLDEMRFIAHLPGIVSPSCLPLLNTMPRALHEIPPRF
jgi:hypothetical protein